MRPHLSIITLVVIVLTSSVGAGDAHATAQELDLVVIDGKKFYFVETPMMEFWIKTRQVPMFDPVSSSNWKAYTATWEIRDGKLFLTSFTAHLKGKPFDVQRMLGAPLPVEAKWLSGPLHAVDNVTFESVRRYSEDARRLYFLDGVLQKTSVLKRVRCCEGRVGISLGKRGELMVIRSISAGSPANKSSRLETGDIVEALTDLDGEIIPLKGMGTHRAHQLIRGLDQQTLSLQIRKAGMAESTRVDLRRVLVFDGKLDRIEEAVRAIGNQ